MRVLSWFGSTREFKRNWRNSLVVWVAYRRAAKKINGCLQNQRLKWMSDPQEYVFPLTFHQLAWRMSPPVFSYQLTLLLMSYMRTFSHLTGCSVDDWQEESNQGVWNEKKKCHIHKSQFEVNPFKTVRPYNTQARSRWWAGRLEPIQFELHGGEVYCSTRSWSIWFTTTTFNALHEQINLTDKNKRPWALWRIIKHGFPLYIGAVWTCVCCNARFSFFLFLFFC